MTSQSDTLSPPPTSLSVIFAQREAERAAKRAHTQHDHFEIACVAASVIIMAYSSLFSIVPILVFYGLWLPRVLHKGVAILLPPRRSSLGILLPLLACFSAFWSGYRGITLHHGVELLSMLLCVIVIARHVDAEHFAKGVCIGATLSLLASLASRRYGFDSFSGTYSLIGLFGSKNQVGFMAEIGIVATLALLPSVRGIIPVTLFCVIPFAVYLVSLYLCKSATAVLSLALTVAVISCVYAVTRFTKQSRLPIIGISVIAIAAVVLAALNLDLEDTVLHKFGKDTTLTGRTYLWQEGTRIGMEHPVLGHGYTAFWVQGQKQAERYWFEFGIPSKSGFHFHNLFVQTFVDLGALGCLLMALLLLSACRKSLRNTLQKGLTTECILALGIAFMFLARAFVEVDLLGPFGIGLLMFFYPLFRPAR
ncbi:MAG TPA: O-antigen ligase family protein [Rickettsiales bacterium]|nr:O-antigen ligase family protein [Rickettsiales bacterium]